MHDRESANAAAHSGCDAELEHLAMVVKTAGPLADRTAALECLAQSKSPFADELMADIAATAGDPTLRAHAFRKVAERGGIRAIRAIIDGFSDPDENVAGVALSLLARCGTSLIESALLSILTSDARSELQWRAALFLAERGNLSGSNVLASRIRPGMPFVPNADGLNELAAVVVLARFEHADARCRLKEILPALERMDQQRLDILLRVLVDRIGQPGDSVISELRKWCS